MTKIILKYLIMMFSVYVSNGQTFVNNFDHLTSVLANSSVRLADASIQRVTAKRILKFSSETRDNHSKMLITKEFIFNSLKNINSAFENTKQLVIMSDYVTQIVDYNTQSIDLALQNPEVLIFTQHKISFMTQEMIEISESLYNIILNESEDLLMDYQTRQDLINSLRNRLLVMRGMSRSLLSLISYRVNLGIGENILTTWFPEETILINNIMNTWPGIKL